MNIRPSKFIKAVLFSILLVGLSFTLPAQKINLNSAWTDGGIAFYPDSIKDGIIHFFGGSLHEGGYVFCLRINTNGQLSIYDKGDDCDHGFNRYRSVELKTINGIQVLLLKNEAGHLEDCYRQTYPDETLRSLIIKIKINHELAGKYVNPATGKAIIFSADKQSASGLDASTRYKFEEEYDSPSEVITFDNKRSYMYKLTEKGLDIYIAKKENEDADWEAGKKLMSLVKTEWLNTDSLKDVPGKYPFASRELLIGGILYRYSSSKLALMRNEIFARHGYIFKSPTLKNYFEKQSWYHPLKENIDTELSDLERLNIQLLRWYEGKQAEEEAMMKRDSH